MYFWMVGMGLLITDPQEQRLRHRFEVHVLERHSKRRDVGRSAPDASFAVVAQTLPKGAALPPPPPARLPSSSEPSRTLGHLSLTTRHAGAFAALPHPYPALPMLRNEDARGGRIIVVEHRRDDVRRSGFASLDSRFATAEVVRVGAAAAPSPPITLRCFADETAQPIAKRADRHRGSQK